MKSAMGDYVNRYYFTVRTKACALCLDQGKRKPFLQSQIGWNFNSKVNESYSGYTTVYR